MKRTLAVGEGVRADSERLAGLGPFDLAGRRVEPATLRIVFGAEELRVEAKVMRLLVYLAGKANQVVSRRELEQAVWDGRIVSEDAVTNAVVKLRRAFQDDAHRPRVIETVPKVGYRLIATVQPPISPSTRHASSGLASAPFIQKMRRRWPQLVIPALVLLAGAAWWLSANLGAVRTPVVESGPATVVKPAVAVLPFQDLGADGDREYFANGITTDIITDLSKLSGLFVIAPGSVFAYRDDKLESRKLARKLGVGFVVRGSVQHAGDRLRVNVQLIDVARERALWGERYDGAVEDVFRIQDEVIAGIAAALKIQLEPTEQQRLARRPTVSVEAYDLLLRGMEEYGHRTPEGNRLAMDYFERAVALDPEFARGYAALALVYARRAMDGWTAIPSRALTQAFDLAQRAADLDETLPQIGFVEGQVALFSGRHERAIEATQRALSLDPNYADAKALLAWIVNYAGRPAEALAALDEAMRLNPAIPAAYSEILGEIRFMQRDDEAAVEAFERALAVNPAHSRARLWLAAANTRLGRRDEAEWQLQELLVLNPELSLARMKSAFPFKDPRETQTFLSILREAGFPP